VEWKLSLRATSNIFCQETGIKLRGLRGQVLSERRSHMLKSAIRHVRNSHSHPATNSFQGQKDKTPTSPASPIPTNLLAPKARRLGSAVQCLSTPASPWSQLIAPSWGVPTGQSYCPGGRNRVPGGVACAWSAGKDTYVCAFRRKLCLAPPQRLRHGS